MRVGLWATLAYAASSHITTLGDESIRCQLYALIALIALIALSVLAATLVDRRPPRRRRQN